MKRIAALAAALLLLIPIACEAAVHHHKTRHNAVVASAGTKVWVNTKTGVYHLPGERWYGRTRSGAYMTESQAKSQGYRATENGQ